MSIFINLYDSIGDFFSSGKDKYTQTRFHNTNFQLVGNKQEVWVDTSRGNLFKLYDTTPQLKAVINRKAAMYSNGVYKHMKLTKDGEVEVENSEIVDRLNNPNPLQNGKEFMFNDSISYDIYGDSIIYLNRPLPTSLPRVMFVLPAEEVKINVSGKLWKQYQLEDIITTYDLYNGNEILDNFEPKEILHFKTINPKNPVYGHSVINSLMMPISNIRGSYGFRNRIITNNAALGFMSSDAKDGLGISFDTKMQKTFNDGYSQAFGMQEGKSNVLMTEASVRWNPMSYPTKDLMLFEEVDSDFRALIDGYGLNDNIFSREKASTFSNLRDGIRMAYEDCIFPFAENRATALTKQFGLDGVNEWIEIDYSHLNILKKDDVEESTADKNRADAQSIRARTIIDLIDAGLVELARSIELND